MSSMESTVLASKTHKKQILEWLEKNKSITPLDALHYIGCYRLSARIYDLRQEGNVIETDKSNGYATYFLHQKNGKVQAS